MKFISGLICCLINTNPKVVLDGTLVFKHKVCTQAIDESSNRGIIESKNATIIHVKNNDTLIVHELAGVTGGLVEAPKNQALNKLLVPVVPSLFEPIQIIFTLYKVGFICVFGVIKLAKPFL